MSHTIVDMRSSALTCRRNGEREWVVLRGLPYFTEQAEKLVAEAISQQPDWETMGFRLCKLKGIAGRGCHTVVLRQCHTRRDIPTSLHWLTCMRSPFMYAPLPFAPVHSTRHISICTVLITDSHFCPWPGVVHHVVPGLMVW